MSGDTLQLAPLAAAFWTAVALYRGDRPLRLVVGLGVGAALAHLGWAVLHWEAVRQHPQALFEPTQGFCVLFVPLGLAVFETSAAAWRTLPLALAVARLGCLASGCCHGQGGLPTPLLEILGLVVLHVALGRLEKGRVLPLFSIGFGAIRLLSEPLRAVPPLGVPSVPAGAIATAWVVAGMGIAALRAYRRSAQRLDAFLCLRWPAPGQRPIVRARSEGDTWDVARTGAASAGLPSPCCSSARPPEPSREPCASSAPGR